MTKKKTLFLEDEEIIQRLCGRLLGRLDHELIVASQVKDAIAIIRGTPLDVLITDLNLSDGNGVDVIRQFKEKHPSGEVIVLTGSSIPEDGFEESELSSLRYFTKPFDPGKLEEAVRDALA